MSGVQFVLNNLELVFGVVLLLVAFVTGTLVEERHFKSLEQREAAMVFVPVANFGNDAMLPQVERVELVTGNAVICADYFKNFLSGLVSLFGGRINTLESVLDRGRREAVLRLMANAAGADCILNLRYETSCITEMQTARELPKVETFAYGTAIYLKK